VCGSVGRKRQRILSSVEVKHRTKSEDPVLRGWPAGGFRSRESNRSTDRGSSGWLRLLCRRTRLHSNPRCRSSKWPVFLFLEGNRKTRVLSAESPEFYVLGESDTHRIFLGRHFEVCSKQLQLARDPPGECDPSTWRSPARDHARKNPEAV